MYFKLKAKPYNVSQPSPSGWCTGLLGDFCSGTVLNFTANGFGCQVNSVYETDLVIKLYSHPTHPTCLHGKYMVSVSTVFSVPLTA